jgi:hypothetical protein
METSDNGNGRDVRGRFLPGNPGGPGNPVVKQVAAYRRALQAATPEDDFELVALQLIEQAKAGVPWAVREFLNRLLGPPPRADAAILVDSEPAGQLNPITTDLALVVERWNILPEAVRTDILALVRAAPTREPG